MEYKFVNVNEVVRVGARVRVDILKYKNFVGTITEIQDGKAFIRVPFHYSTQDQYLETVVEANQLYKYI